MTTGNSAVESSDKEASQHPSSTIFLSFNGQDQRFPFLLAEFLTLHGIRCYNYRKESQLELDWRRNTIRRLDQSKALVFFHNRFSDAENVDTGNTLGEVLLALNQKLPIYLLRDANLPWRESRLSKMEEFNGLTGASEVYDPDGSVWEIGQMLLRRLRADLGFPIVVPLQNTGCLVDCAKIAIAPRAATSGLLRAVAERGKLLVDVFGARHCGKTFLISDVIPSLRKVLAPHCLGIFAFRLRERAENMRNKSTANSVGKLVPEFARFSRAVSQWFERIDDYGLRREEQKTQNGRLLAENMWRFLSNKCREGQYWTLVIDNFHWARAYPEFQWLFEQVAEAGNASPLRLIFTTVRRVDDWWADSEYFEAIRADNACSSNEIVGLVQAHFANTNPKAKPSEKLMVLLQSRLAQRYHAGDVDEILKRELNRLPDGTVDAAHLSKASFQISDQSAETMLQGLSKNEKTILLATTLFWDGMPKAALRYFPISNRKSIAKITEQLERKLGLLEPVVGGGLRLNERNRAVLTDFLLHDDQGKLLKKLHRCAASYYKSMHGQKASRMIPSDEVAAYVEEFCHVSQAEDFKIAAARVTTWDFQLSPVSGYLLRFGRALDVRRYRIFLQERLDDAVERWINFYQLGLACTRLHAEKYLDESIAAHVRGLELAEKAERAKNRPMRMDKEIVAALRLNSLKGASLLYLGLARCRREFSWSDGLEDMRKALELNIGRPLEGNNRGHLAAQLARAIRLRWITRENRSWESASKAINTIGGQELDILKVDSDLEATPLSREIIRNLAIAVDLNEKAGDRRSALFWANELAVACHRFHSDMPPVWRTSTPFELLSKALEIAHRLGDAIIQRCCQQNLAELFLDKGQWSDALTHCEAALGIARRTADEEGIQETERLLERVHREQIRAPQ